MPNAFELSADEKAELAPAGVIKAAVAVGPAASAVWCVRDEASGEARGVTITLAKEIALRTGLPLELVEFSSSGDIVSNADSGLWTLSFVPVDDQRRQVLGVGPNYYLGVSTYLARKEAFKTLQDVDQAGVRVAGVAGTATLRSAERTLKNTSIDGYGSLDEAMAKFRSGELDAIALGKESIISMLPGLEGCHAVDGHFHEAGTAIVVPQKNVQALQAAVRIMDEMKSNGSMRAAYDQNQMSHADVAP
ncbi:transporter substrate-binding domain-containing protein [Rhizobium mongolense]|uniref:Polar amino acid transport system substrate-binding protein n=2 Tax=Rhizobium mongolense TaxID=57676 RepID=A0ABR6IT37_9HYPH|nr:transporter substrate-binding domain-containing protein [Rhizobium mongolense]MBB4231031.1 polar amino acid transport system substrate-binding protein [Rhizobium mongolense]TVZ66181.1 polar amino acid transport system substrate-binding protein [Rhizobium mongolense USDA 1844]